MNTLQYYAHACREFHSHTRTLIANLLTHSCHERTDRFLTRVFNSNHINPPLGKVGVSTRQALSQQLCWLGISIGLQRESEGEVGERWGRMNDFKAS